METGGPLNRYAFLFQYPTGFLHFNMINKDCINMPFAMMGQDPLIHHLWVAMYSASKANNCAYCSTHGVAMASTKKTKLLLRMIEEENRSLSDSALISFSDSLGRFPSDLSTDEIVTLKKYYTSDEIEWIVLSIAMSGCNNFVSQACGVKLEEKVLDAAKPYLPKIPEYPTDAMPEGFDMEATKPKDINEEDPVDENMFPLWKLFRRHPMAMIQSAIVELKWKRGVPSSWPKIGQYLKEHTGYHFPLLQRLANFRNMTQCFGGVLRDSFDPNLTEIGLTTKVLVQLIWSGHIYDEHLQEDACTLLPIMAKRENIEKFDTDEMIEEMLAIAEDPCPNTKDECEDVLDKVSHLCAKLAKKGASKREQGFQARKQAAILILARAAATKPTRIDPVVIGEIVNLLKPSEIIETIVWMGVLVGFHRILRFNEIKENTPMYIWEDKEELLPRTSGHNSDIPPKPHEKSESCAKKTFFSWMPWCRSE